MLISFTIGSFVRIYKLMQFGSYRDIDKVHSIFTCLRLPDSY